MQSIRLALAVLLSLSLVIFQVPIQAFAQAATTAALSDDLAGPEVSGLKINGAALPEDGAASVANAAWQSAGKTVRVAGIVKDPLGLKSTTMTLTSPADVEGNPVNLYVSYTGTFSILWRLPETGVWTVTLTSTDKAENVTTVTFTIEILPDVDGPALSLTTLGGRTIPADGNFTLVPEKWASNKTPELKGRVVDISGVQQLTVAVTSPDAVTETAEITSAKYGYFTYKLNLTTAGTWTFDFQAEDKAGNTTTKTLTVSIAEDVDGPVFTGLKVGSAAVPETNVVTVSNTEWYQSGKKVLLTGNVTDSGIGVKSARVTLTSPENVESAPVALKPLPTGGFASALPLASVGIWTVTLDAEDNFGNLTTQSFTVEVLPDTTGPALTFTTLGGRYVPADKTVNLTTAAWLANKTPELRGRAVDPAGVQAVTVTVTAPDSTTTTAIVTVGTTGFFTYKLNLTTAGTWTYAFSATDKVGNDSTATVTVVVQADTEAPVLTLKLNGSAVEAEDVVTVTNANWVARGKRVYFSGLATDVGAGLKSLTYVVTKPDGTATTNKLAPVNGRFGFYVSLPVTGTWAVAFTAVDKLDNATTATVSVVIEP